MGMCLRVPYHCPGYSDGRAVDVEYGTDRRLIVQMGTCGKKNYMSLDIYVNRNSFDGFAVDLWSAVSVCVTLSPKLVASVGITFFAYVCPNLFVSTNCHYIFERVMLYINHGFPPYDMPTREDDRFDIICSGDLMRQLQAWDSTCILLIQLFFCYHPSNLRLQ